MGIPYTYRITHLPSGKHYYGARYAKDCHPSDLWVIYFTSSKTNEHYIGFGITNNINYRTKVHKMNANKSGFVANIVKLIYFSSGGDALLLERELKHTLPITNTKIIGFKTEAILAKDFNLLHKALGIYD